MIDKIACFAAIVNAAAAIIAVFITIYLQRRIDERDNMRHSRQIDAEANRFIQKYNSKSFYDSDIFLLPLCVCAYKYDKVFPFKRAIYRDFCGLSFDVQKALLERYDISISLDTFNHEEIFYDMRNILNDYVEDYDMGEGKSSLDYVLNKYIKALACYNDMDFPEPGNYPLDEYEQAVQNDMFRETVRISHVDDNMLLSKHISNLMSKENNKNIMSKLSDVWDYFSMTNDLDESFVYSLVVYYAMLYSLNDDCLHKFNYIDNYKGEHTMEDLFLASLFYFELIRKK